MQKNILFWQAQLQPLYHISLFTTTSFVRDLHITKSPIAIKLQAPSITRGNGLTHISDSSLNENQMKHNEHINWAPNLLL